ncbi:MAG: hypothetical protein HY332_16665 [Chloroflexi bacterium]|nr:hypothetical protein [Chloroflexota bacterium]
MGRKSRKRVQRLAIETRRALVAERVLAHKSVREIAAELHALPAGQRPRDCSPSTVGRDRQWWLQEWARAQTASTAELVGEEVARLKALEAVWWPKALAGDREATDRVLAIQRQRMGLMGIGRGGGRAVSRVQVEGAAAAKGGVDAAATVMRVVVDYVDDWR